jgi:surface protein
MFYTSTNLTGNFSGWDTSKITTMTNLFYGATNFDQDLSSWNVEKVTAANFANMFNGTQLSLYNYNAILDSRSRQNVIASATSFTLPNTPYGGCVSNAQAGIEGHQRLTQALADGGKARAIVDSGVVMCRPTPPLCDTPDITFYGQTLMACNVGASVAGKKAVPDAYGDFFQRGNNFGFLYSGTLTTTSDKPDTSSY